MKSIHFYISNPNHHWQMMKPMMAQLKSNNVNVILISLCEFRRMPTPEKELIGLGIPFFKLASLKFKGTTTSTGKKYIGGNQAFVRNFMRTIIWHAKIKKELEQVNTQRPDWVVVPNDIAYPFNRICDWFTKKGIRFLLFQEGIRFPLPNEEGAMAYGTNGATEILTWGSASTDYFNKLGVRSKVVTVGNPRFDALFNGNDTLRDKNIPFAKYNVLYVSNPIDDQGFCTHEEKIKLFKSFLKGIEKLSNENDIRLFVRLHPREDGESFREAVQATAFKNVSWAQEFSLFDYLKRTDLTVVLASTVGLESMMVDVPIAVIKLPRYGFVFDYVQSGSAIGIDVDTDFSVALWNAITTDKQTQIEKSYAYVNRQLSNRGNSSTAITNHILNLLDGH
jgi:hypothetical protein